MQNIYGSEGVALLFCIFMYPQFSEKSKEELIDYAKEIIKMHKGCIKAYNNVLKLMLNGKEDKDAPYNLFIEMLTPIEKYKFGEVDKDTKGITFRNDKVTTYIYGQNIFDLATLVDVFKGTDLKVDDKDIDLLTAIKKQHLRIGVI